MNSIKIFSVDSIVCTQPLFDWLGPVWSTSFHYKTHTWGLNSYCSHKQMKMAVRSELESVGRAACFMILQIDGAPTSRWWQINLILGKGVFIFSNPVAQSIRVICGNDSYLWKCKNAIFVVTNIFTENIFWNIWKYLHMLIIFPSWICTAVFILL